MGATTWHYYLPYQPDPEVALQSLRAEVFTQGAYLDPANAPQDYIRRRYEEAGFDANSPECRTAQVGRINMFCEHMFRLSFTVLALLTIGADRRLDFTAEGPKNAEARGAVSDQQGDPLPDGALARMGAIRWRHGDTVVFVGFTADNKSVLTVSMDKVVRLWDRATGKEVRRFTAAAPPPAPGQAMDYFTRFHIGAGRAALSPDGKLCAAVRPGDVIQIWNAATGDAHAPIRAPSEHLPSRQMAKCWPPARPNRANQYSCTMRSPRPRPR